MRKAIRIFVGSVVVVAALGFFVPSTVQAQVRFEGRFRLPHGDIAIGVGDPYYRRGYYGSPYYPVGSYVPYGYRVIRERRLGYGFYSPAFRCRAHSLYHSHWIPVRRYGPRYVVVQQPVFVERRVYDDGYYNDGYDGRYDDGNYGRRDYGRHDCDGPYSDPYRRSYPYDR